MWTKWTKRPLQSPSPWSWGAMSIISRPPAAVAALTNLKLQRAAGGEHHPGTRWRCLHMPMYDLYSFGSTLCGFFAGIWIWTMYEHVMSSWCPFLAHKTLLVASRSTFRRWFPIWSTPWRAKSVWDLESMGFTARVWRLFSFSKFPLVPFSDLSNLELHGKKHNQIASTRGMTPQPLQVSTGTYSPSYQMNRSWRCILRRCHGWKSYDAVDGFRNPVN